MQTGSALRDLFHKNYRRLEQLCGEILPLPGLMRSHLHWHSEVLVLELIEENLFRSEILLYSREVDGEHFSEPCPLFRVDLQHERKWAEVLSVQDEFGSRGTQNAELSRNEKAMSGINRQLGLWLEQALLNNHKLYEIKND